MSCALALNNMGSRKENRDESLRFGDTIVGCQVEEKSVADRRHHLTLILRRMEAVLYLFRDASLERRAMSCSRVLPRRMPVSLLERGPEMRS